MSSTSLRRRLFRWLLRHLSLYPPFLGAGVRVHADLEHHAYRAELHAHWYNRNTWGTHFGGSIFAMTDPFYALILQDHLGPGFQVWMKQARIDYLRPGTGTICADFHIPEPRMDEIRSEVEAKGRAEPAFSVDVLDGQARVVAHVDQVLHVRRSAGPDLGNPREGATPVAGRV